MSIDLKSVNDENFVEWRRAVRAGFGQHVHPDDITRLRNDRAEIDRLVAAVDSDTGRIVGTGGVDSFSLTVPGGNQVPMAGVAYMTTAATHRRQGTFTRMMNRIHEEARDRGDVLAGLWASQSHLYGRYDYGLAVNSFDWKIDPHYGDFAHSPGTDASIYFVQAGEAAGILPGIYDQFRNDTPGGVDRTAGAWCYLLFDEERVRGGASALFFAVCEEDGEQTGYVMYRMRRQGDSDMGTLQLEELIALTDIAHASLWRFLLNYDLVGQLTAENMPADDPLWWMLADPRRLRRSRHDSLWLRFIDIEKALEARTYGIDGQLNIRLHSEHQPEVNGTYSVDVSAGAARVKRTSERADVDTTPRDLSVIYMGSSNPYSLVEAGRISAVDQEQLSKLHLMFSTDSAPWCPHYF